MLQKLKLEELDRQSIPDFIASEKKPIVVILDNIRSAMNVGSFFRTCDAFAVQQLVLCGYTAIPPHKEITKTAIGATESVTWLHFETTIQAIEHFRDLNYKVIAVEQTNQSIELTKISDIAQPIALVFGNEVDGVDEEIVKLADQCVEITQFGTKHSLNVSVCGGIVIHHFSSKYKV